MARLPQPGGDANNWGDVLNDYLKQSINDDGTLKDTGIIADKLDKSGGTMGGDIAMGNNKITGIADGVDSTDAPSVGQMSSAISDSETDLASVGTEVTDLTSAARDDSVWQTTYNTGENFVPIVQDGVAKKMPLELFTTMQPAAVTQISGTSHTWGLGENVLYCTNTSALIITLPTFASAPGMHSSVRVVRLGTGSVTLQAGASATVNKAASLPLTLNEQYSVAFFWPYAWSGGATTYVAWGDLG